MKAKGVALKTYNDMFLPCTKRPPRSLWMKKRDRQERKGGRQRSATK